MPLDLAEIVPGCVAMLEAEPLIADPAVQYGGEEAGFRSSPFLCVHVENGICTWLYLTTKLDKRGLRLEIKSEWRLEGSNVWQQSACYVGDARKPFSGPIESFVVAAANELPHQPHNRPHVSAEGVDAALREIQKYRRAP